MAALVEADGSYLVCGLHASELQDEEGTHRSDELLARARKHRRSVHVPLCDKE